VEHGRREAEGRAGAVTVVEAILLSIVALTAAWSGFAAAQWSTDSNVKLAESSTAQLAGNRAALQAAETRNFDASAFDGWFAAYTVGNARAMEIAERRFRPEFRVAFDAWQATSPETNPDAPPAPIFMPEYEQPQLEEAQALDEEADRHFQEGTKAGRNSDDYVRVTVFLASVLFIVGISTQFRASRARYGLVGVGVVMLAVAFVQLAQLPRPEF
jgi:hypothetical protein